ncbi:MAG: TerC family protein [Thermoplasmatales archaeon]|nr:TerC family protein [Thermoplasmatales archaeon]
MEWAGFLALVAFLLVLDLGVFNRGHKAISTKKAIALSAFWIALALLFNVYVYYRMGSELAMEFLAAYVVEKSMSVDNLFVFILIFSSFRIPPEYQHEALFYGIIGALVFRAIFIFAGVGLLENFSFMMYVFGAFLIYAAVKAAVPKKEKDPREGRFVKFLVSKIRATDEFEGGKLFVRKDGLLYATPIFMAILVIEFADIVFAIDSIPAVLAITTDTFIVYTSNIFAILGLRSLYFALAGILGRYTHIGYGIAVILAFVGVKMIISDHYHIPVAISLAVILGVLAVTAVLSVIIDRRGGGGKGPDSGEGGVVETVET